MEAFTDLRLKLGYRFLKKRMKGIARAKRMTSIKKASSVGILFDMDSMHTYQAVHDYALKLQDRKVRVKVIGFATDDRLTRQLLPVLSFDFILKKNLNWYFRPKTLSAEDFIRSGFDICINLAKPGRFPLVYLTGMSDAALKVGAYSVDEEEIYDLMVHTTTKHDQKRFLEDVHDYLTILNPKENA